MSLLEGLKIWRARAAKATTDYSFHMAITGWGEHTADEMRAVVRDHGITSFKVFMAYKGAIMVDDHALYQVMKVAAETGAVVTVHAENGDVVWNLQRELVAKGLTNRDIADALYISENTVKNHVRNILEKLHLHSRMEAVVYAVREKLLDIH